MMILSRRLGITLVACALAALGGAGCGDSTTQPLPPTAASLDGDWGRADEVPGSSEQWVLTLTGTSIAAQGVWTGEACCSGTIAGTGSVVGDSLHLDLKFFDGPTPTGTPRFAEHVDAVQPTQHDITGTAIRDGASVSIHMQRLVVALLSAAGTR
ncbi:MAG TPA: hypothetical protein VGM67_19455 [Gemmatimonadaceae bacterium]|jgi:hypothetical protein